MESYLQQFRGTRLIKRGSIKIEKAFGLIKYTNLQSVFSDTYLAFPSFSVPCLPSGHQLSALLAIGAGSLSVVCF